MKRTFVTVMPNHIGAFLKASRCFAEIGVNITRVSYNKAVDSHMLFIDAKGTKEQLDAAAKKLQQHMAEAEIQSSADSPYADLADQLNEP